MTDLPKMTKAEAYLYYDFVMWRLLGWEVVERTRHHPNSKPAKEVSERFFELKLAQPEFDHLIAAAMAGTPVHTLWPERLQVEVERQIHTKVPRACNEPTSAEFAERMREDDSSEWEWPSFLKDHGREP
ncbi:hypothetical protein [Rhizobium rhizogenes]|uniref:hypothetical protein n=1 Tax=Rhizobium rhizogenes TaxID=359 RepID=UPI001571D1D2|nr:hypothetical protein [Rhizobium rhizogenes]NTG09244.1 hypothetical protein [Rhizobium rhizogenes]